jgi:hypothetical protein
VHVDEKWFFLTEAQLRLYLVPGESEPERSTRHKSHILKVMFLAAVARPRYTAEGECSFDGKIGIWPFVERVQAQRGSVNRPAGTWETKPVSVTAERYRTFMIEKVLPAIKASWPDRERKITIQQDGASSHIKQDDPAFGALQSSQWDHGFAHEINGLIEQVTRAYREYSPRKVDFGFLTLQSVLEQILISNGGNNYKIPHMGKERLLRDGVLPLRIRASATAVSVARQVMDDGVNAEIDASDAETE